MTVERVASLEFFESLVSHGVWLHCLIDCMSCSAWCPIFDAKWRLAARRLCVEICHTSIIDILERVLLS